MIITTLQPELNPKDLKGNLDRIKAMADAAFSESHFDLLLLPENFPMWGSKLGRNGESEKVVDFLRNLGKNYKSVIIGGSFHNIDSADSKYYNTCYVFDGSGQKIGEYKKHKLFDREIKYNVSPGEKPLIFEVKGWRIGIEICADLWYPELSRNFVGKIDILAVPAMSVVRKMNYQEYGRSLWHSLVMTRSQENTMVTVVADHPAHDRKPFCSGAMSICDPSLSINTNNIGIIHLKNEGGADYLTVHLDKKRLEKFRNYRIEKGMLPVSNLN